MNPKLLTETDIFRIGRTLLCLLFILPFNKVIAQPYQFSDVKEAYYLFAERKVFYPDFAFATNSSVGLQSFKNEQGKYGFKIIIDEKVAPIYSVYTKVKDNILDIGFEDRYDFRALMRVTLLSNGKLQMYFPPEKTKTADIFVYAYRQPRETGFSWYEPTLDGLIFHPEAKTGQEAVKKYYTRTLNGSFSEQIYRGEQIIEGKTDKKHIENIYSREVPEGQPENDIINNEFSVADIVHRSFVSLFNDTLQQAVNDYNALLMQYPYNYDKNRIAYSLSMNLPNNERFLHDTLHTLLEIISAKKLQLKEQYKKDSLLFRQFNVTLQEKISEANAQLLNNPYNLHKRTIDNGLTDSLFGNTEELTKELHLKLSAIPKWQNQIEKEIYAETRKDNPILFCEIYFSQNPSQIQLADSIYLECRCKYPGRNAFEIAFIDNTLLDCDCRVKKYQEFSYLYHSHEEFDKSYNQEEDAFFQEVEERKQDKRKLMHLAETLAAQKQVKMRKALSSSKQEMLDIANQVSQHRNGYYYEDAIELIFKYNDKLSKEWDKNGIYFKSKTEMYDYYIGEDYEKVLKTKKKK